MTFITKTSPCYVGSAKRKLNVYPCCQFVFCLNWKPTQQEAQQTWKKELASVQEIERECKGKWFLYQPEPLLEYDKCTIRCDFAIQTDK